MNTSIIYVALSVAVLVIIAILVFLTGKGREKNRLTPLASLAYAFVLAGIIFGDDRIIGYSLMGAGVILALVDIINRSRTK
jgi:uncharacterized membrane protein